MQSKTPMSRRALLGGVMALASGAPAWAKKQKKVIPPGRVARVISGQSFALQDGRTVRLGSIDAPRMAYQDIHAEPLARTARNALAHLIQDRVLSFEEAAPDRYDRLKAQVYAQADPDEDPVWIQGAMIRHGHARVHTWRDNHAQAAELLRLEQNARAARRGIWAEAYYAVRNPQTIGASVGSFQIVQGRIVDAAIVQKRVYLNFGSDWREDFTISIAPKDARRFERAGINLAGLSGVRVRARGLIRTQNGPILYLDHPEALEILSD
ncbi:MAG: thermonuclease family protein [Robiginitomaculum sp.]|nr:thermonuclease family protein [Robiginitomaculum sp.]MDQ7076593.1 thermonuclease family protein [Robiginitomaculum sp.]